MLKERKLEWYERRKLQCVARRLRRLLLERRFGNANPMVLEPCETEPVPRVKTLRCALGLTQEQFANRYQIPIGTLRNWEQGRSEPDQRARGYLRIIAREPEGVHRVLKVLLAWAGISDLQVPVQSAAKDGGRSQI